MTTQEILDLAAEFDLITFGPQDLVMFAREVEAKTIERCAQVCEDLTMGTNVALVGVGFAESIRALGEDE